MFKFQVSPDLINPLAPRTFRARKHGEIDLNSRIGWAERLEKQNNAGVGEKDIGTRANTFKNLN